MSTLEMELLTVEEVASILKLTPGSVLDHTQFAEPRIPAIRFNKKVLRFRKSDIQKFIEDCAGATKKRATK